MTQELTVVEKRKTIIDLLGKIEPRMKKLIAPHLTPARMLRLAIGAFETTPKLLDCTPTSLLRCVMQASLLGLEINSPLQQAYLVPFFNKGRMECVLIPDYRGLMDLARASEKVESLYAEIVYEKDSFIYQLGSNPFLEHTKTLDAKPGDPKAVYAIAFLSGAQHAVFEVIPYRDIIALRDRIAAKNKGADSPWKTDEAAMARKTAIKRLCKWLPRDPKLGRATTLDNRFEQGESQEFEDDIIDIVAEATGVDPASEKGQPPIQKPQAKTDSQPAPGSADDDQTVITTITSAVAREGTKKDGKTKYHTYFVETSEPNKYSTFSDTLGAECIALEGKTVNLIWRAAGQYRNVVGVSEVSEASE